MGKLFSILDYGQVNNSQFDYKLELCDEKDASKAVKTIQLKFTDDNKNGKLDADDFFTLKSNFWSNFNNKNINLDADNFRQKLTEIVPGAVIDSVGNLDKNCIPLTFNCASTLSSVGIKYNSTPVTILNMTPSDKGIKDTKNKNNDIMAVYDLKFSNKDEAKIIFRDYNKSGKLDAGDSFEFQDGESIAPINLDAENFKQKLAEVVPNAEIQDGKFENNTCQLRFGVHFASDSFIKDKTVNGVIPPPSVEVSTSDTKNVHKPNLIMNSINKVASFVLSPIKKDTYKKFVQTLETKKPELMSKLNIDSDTYNDLANLSTGIVEQETEFGTGLKYLFKENFQGCISFMKKRHGKTSFNSRGLSQIKISAYTDPATKHLLSEYGINKNNLKKPENSAIATLIVLTGMSKNELPGLKYRLSKLKMDKDDALLYLWNGKRDEIMDETAIPSKNEYILNVKKYSKKIFDVKQPEDYSSAINNEVDTVVNPQKVDTLPEMPDYFSSDINNETKKAVTKSQMKQVKQVDTLPEVHWEGW